MKNCIRHSPSNGAGSPDVWGVYEADTGSVQYLVADPKTREAAIIDGVQNFDPRSASTHFGSADQLLALAKEHDLRITWVLDTHPHADHLMASWYLKEQTNAPNAIGAKVNEIAELWSDYYHLPNTFKPTADFDYLFEEGDQFTIGELQVDVWLSPGHTLGSITYLVGDAAFVHDTLMYPDSGTSRADFPGGSSIDLWNTLQRILSLPDATRLFIGHDYGKDGREPQWEATVAEHKQNNIHLAGDVSEAEYRKLRQERDETLSLPDRMLHALQVNLRAGKLPEPEADGHRYFKIPANRFE
ncbi:Beta-lactamase hydrolase-like protein [Pseudidiomarina piscicola]|uniref:Beta-lactamase hydrolase-like protein n=1 Tax=Pseudidiomarina piscicola TaxID=2614830 RepID=A0A6S6WTX4_9GAMM|nr:MBL fold metallo-hydrolase [Pseudidiomarina piscicola]CAB0150314.1 Beta-lactamase hydrolase-like protein [Pseudidiomarina piscicola]VZT39744.1 Beta-lactamase hydrolase-like protein [Pseudomonas aeruginosa]